MVDVYSKALDEKLKVKRFLVNIKGTQPGATVVFFGGIHGNENSGVIAIKEALKNIYPEDVNGHIIGITGNLKALELQQRFIDEDLNRLWTKTRIEAIKNKTALNKEQEELVELLKILETILKTHKPPFYFIDLHTTSSKTLPFITINDALINRKFSKQFPVPIVLGIEEYLNGPLLSYINALGFVSLGFESGQHHELRAISNSIAFIGLTLKFSGVLKTEQKIDIAKNHDALKTQAANLNTIFEIVHLHKVAAKDKFKMLNGFTSFQLITKGTVLATANKTKITAPSSGRIFMPLYQQKGAEGFFIIKPINTFFLNLSVVLRRLKTDSVLVLLPGVSWFNKKEGVLQVNLKVARFFAKSFFHLLGYRNKQVTATHLRLNNRERVAKTHLYKNEVWY